ncbi:hypothetical protein JXA85_01300 [Candidatus Woesearchaeota archaeon]|nr:hypothetical protein [Candidatus Woesearchaeota archaeon]
MKNGIRANLKKLREFILPDEDKLKREKSVLYLRVYTDLLQAQSNMTNFKSFSEYLKIVRNIIKTSALKGEECYLSRIQEIINELLVSKKGRAYYSKDHHIDYAKTKLHVAQNICILRILGD